MKLIPVYPLLIALAAFPALGDSRVSYQVEESSGQIISITAEDDSAVSALADDSPVRTAEAFMSQHAAALGASWSDLKLLRLEEDQQGMRHLRYAVEKHGIPLYGGEISVHLTKSGKVSSAGGRAADISDIDTTPTLTAANAIAMAKRHWLARFNEEADHATTPQLFLFNEGFIRRNQNSQTALAWKLMLANNNNTRLRLYFIDAHTGAVYLDIDNLQTAVYRRVFDCSTNDVSCWLDYATWTFTWGRSEGEPARSLHSFLDTRGYNEVNLAYDYLGASHQYFVTRFGRNGANGVGGLGDGVNNPTWATDAYTYVDYYLNNFVPCPNACFTQNTPSVHFCHGNMGLDLVGHEYTHGMEYYAVRNALGEPESLLYQGESGALNEAYADIFGSAIDYFATGDASDWTVFEDTPNGPGRSLSNPPAFEVFGPMPDRFYANVYCGTEDQSGVHHNNGVLMKAAYLIADGGTFNGCTIQPLGRLKEEAILYRALNYYFTPTTSFNQAYTWILQACVDLYGAEECKQVNKALLAVELNQPGKCSGVPAVNPISACNSIDGVQVVPPPVVEPPPEATPTVAPSASPGAPQIAITAPKPKSKVKGSTVIKFTGTNQVAPKCSLNGKTWIACTSTQTKLSKLPGWKSLVKKARSKSVTFSLHVLDVDGNGNVGSDLKKGLKLSKGGR